MTPTPLVTNDAVVLGILSVILGGVFATSHSESPSLKKFYKVCPPLLLCYFLPGLLGTFGVISGDHSRLYFVASRYLLPACLVLLCLSVDLSGVIRLGPKALIMFFTGTAGIVFGGPLALFIVSKIDPTCAGGTAANALWRGMSTIAGSWIGGGANQTAMKEIFQVGDQVFSAMIAVDVLVASVWMALLLYLAGISEAADEYLRADNSAIKDLQKRLEDYHAQVNRMPTLTDTMKILAVGFGVSALAHLAADFLSPFFKTTAPTAVASLFGYETARVAALFRWLSVTSAFFWLIVLSTIGGVLLSFTSLRKLEGVGASRIGSVFLYILVASIGMKMDLSAVVSNPSYFAIGFIWISFHAILLIVVAKLIRAPVFFLAVGSQANIGGAASAPVVASAFHPMLAPVGVLLAVLGYAVGTLGAWACGLLLRLVAS